MSLVLLLLAACFLAFSNGANDNFKGVATLYGSGTAGYRAAIAWATLTTFAGSIASVVLAEALLRKFSGKGLVADELASSQYFLLTVALGAALAVVLATRLGLPVSTTHALLGALIGAGMASQRAVDLSALGTGFVLPLVLSPVLAIAVGAALHALFHCAGWLLGLRKEWCLCIGADEWIIAIPRGPSMLAMRAVPVPVVAADCCSAAACRQRYRGAVVGIDAQRLVDAAHLASAGMVSFARGLNDTPKIAALLLLVKWLTPATDAALVAVSIAVGGLLAARRVAETMSHRITAMNHGQGFSANLATGILVILASAFGLPVSTTHVAVGSLFGIGLTTGQANVRTMVSIVLFWLVTLPVAAAIAAAAYLAVARFA